jgi:beta-lactamase class D
VKLTPASNSQLFKAPMINRIALAVILAIALPVSVNARTICTVVADAANSKILLEQGDCNSRVTAASTFKIAISLMGYDSGFLKDAHSPSLPYHKGYADWGGDAWRQPTDPTRWIKYSVVWFSQQVTQSLGKARFHKYVEEFRYGNADISGDPGKHNGLTRAWISSSLKISPLEEVTFLERLVNRQLSVTAQAYDMTSQITRITQFSNGWDVHGKTGTGFPKTADGADDVDHGYGWFVGWGIKGARTVVFARLIQDEKAEPANTGIRARDDFLKQLPSLMDVLAP